LSGTLSLCAIPFSELKADKKFMAMFIGFIDGDGYFDIGEQKQYNKKTKAPVKSTIRIRLASNVNIRDLSLLEYFLKVLGVGKISTMSGAREQVRVIFSSPNNHPLNGYKLNQYIIWQPSIGGGSRYTQIKQTIETNSSA